ncbi:hypothetical protein [Nocardia sp. NPDC050175]|uniref:hypothetical protein n=1 Tax=Nocardia sp. NPDC050175 TaxID=3364317 RepID=UPI003796925B
MKISKLTAKVIGDMGEKRQWWQYIEAFARNYQEDSWKNHARQRLTDAIERAAGAGS